MTLAKYEVNKEPKQTQNTQLNYDKSINDAIQSNDIVFLFYFSSVWTQSDTHDAKQKKRSTKIWTSKQCVELSSIPRFVLQQ